MRMEQDELRTDTTPKDFKRRVVWEDGKKHRQQNPHHGRRIALAKGTWKRLPRHVEAAPTCSRHHPWKRLPRHVEAAPTCNS